MSLVDRMVRRFLRWRLPHNFAPDGGIVFERPPESTENLRWPVGTNLLDAEQARQMVDFMLADEVLLDSPEQPSTHRQRVELELSQLTHRIKALRVFLGRRPPPSALPVLLEMQLRSMVDYQIVLEIRLRVWRD